MVLPLIWIKGDKYHIKTECGQYYVAKGYINDTAKYVPYFIAEGKPSAMLSNAVDSADTAKTVCETHNKIRKK